MATVMNGNLNQDGQNGMQLNRKTTKIEFLSQENIQLREQVQELQNIIKLNKEALKIAMQPSIQSSQGHSIYANNENSFNKSNNNINNNLQYNQENSKALSQVLNSLYLENEELIKINEKLTQERNIAQSKVNLLIQKNIHQIYEFQFALINEQISEASQKHEKELILELEEKVMSLTKKVKEQEQTIFGYEKTRPDYDEISGIVIKYRDIISLNDQTVRLHDENERLNTIILKLKRENDNLKSDKQDLVKINMVKNVQHILNQIIDYIIKKQMSNEVLRLKATLATPFGKSSYIQNQNTTGHQIATVALGLKGNDLLKSKHEYVKIQIKYCLIKKFKNSFY